MLVFGLWDRGCFMTRCKKIIIGLWHSMCGGCVVIEARQNLGYRSPGGQYRGYVMIFEATGGYRSLGGAAILYVCQFEK